MNTENRYVARDGTVFDKKFMEKELGISVFECIVSDKLLKMNAVPGSGRVYINGVEFTVSTFKKGQDGILLVNASPKDKKPRYLAQDGTVFGPLSPNPSAAVSGLRNIVINRSK